MARLPHKDFYYSNSIYKDMSAGPYEGFENYKSGVYQKYEDFDSQPEDVFTVFYTPRCPACTNIRPVVQQTLGGIATEYVDYKLGNYNRLGNKAVVMVNVDRYPEVVQRFNIQSFPTLKLLRGVTDRVTLDSTTVVDYTGGRTVTEIDSFIQEGGVSVNVNEYFNSQPEDVFTMFYSPRSPIISRIRPVIQQTLGGIATEYVDYRVGNYNRYGDKAVVMVDVDRYPGMVRKFNLQQFPTFKLLRGVTDRVNLNATTVVDYSGPPAVTEIDSFIQGNGVSVNVNEYFDSQPENVFTLFYTPRCGYCKDVMPVVQQSLGGIATEYVDYRVGNYRRYDNNAVVMVNVDEYPEMAQRFKLQGFPTFKLLRGVTDRTTLDATTVVDYNGGRTVQEIDTFIRG